MKDGYSREINYLRISLTDKCNLKCVYCVAEEEKFEEECINDILSFDDYKFLIANMAELGIKKIKFTGGEPLLYPYLSELISYAKNECNIEDVSISTNGQNFCERALELKESGLDRINLSIDSLREYRYKAVTRGGSLNQVLNTLNTCLRLKMKVKINCVVIKDFNDDEIYDFMQLAKNYNIDVRFIELTPVGESKFLYQNNYVNVKHMVENMGQIEHIEYDYNSPARYYVFKNCKGRIGIIAPISNCFCNDCNRIRITYDGFINLCLHGKEEIDIKPFLQKPILFKESIKDIISIKPKSHKLIEDNISENIRNLNQIGG